MTNKVTVAGWEINLKGRRQELLDLKEQMAAFEKMKPLPLSEIRALTTKIHRCEEKIISFECRIQAAKEDWEQQKQTFEEHKGAAADLVHELDLYWVGQAGGTYMVCTKGDWKPMQVKALKFTAFETQDPEFMACVDEVMIAEKRKFISGTYSWKSPDPDEKKLNMMRSDMCPPIEDGSKPHPFFDIIIRSLAGDKPANILQIKKILLSKYLYPDNPYLPAMVFLDPNGDAGKGLFANVFLRSLFGKNMVVIAEMATLVGKFNDAVRGVAFVYIDEKSGGVADDPEALKRLLCNPGCWSERKYESQIWVDNTAAYCFGSNRTNAVKLEGTRVDRRYQISKATNKLTWYLKNDFLSYLPNETACDNWIKNDGQHIIADRHEMGKWIYHTLSEFAKDPDIDLRNVHGDFGADYQNMLETQKPYYQNVFEAVFTDPKFQFIERRILYDIYKWANKHDNDGYALIRRGRFYEDAEQWCKRHGFDITLQKVRQYNDNGQPETDERKQMMVFTKPNKSDTWANELLFKYHDNSAEWVTYWSDDDAKMKGIKSLKIVID